MTILESQIDRRSKEFADNARAMRALVEDLRAKTAAVREGGELASL